ncbi:MAG: MFS transporter [Bacillota bacterium]|nr:MFS transporter [Bacillota bacterium]
MQFPHLWHTKNKYLSRQPVTDAPLTVSERLWTRDFLAMAALNLLLSVSGNMLVPTMPFYIIDLGGNEFIVGFIAACYSAFALIMRPFSGWMLDNISRKQIFYLSVVLLMLIPIGYALIPILAMVLAMRCFHGMVWAAASTAANTNICDILPKSRFGEGIAYYGLTNSLSMALAPMFGLFLFERFGYTVLFGGVSACALLVLLLLSRVSITELERSERTAAERLPLLLRLAKLFNRDALPASITMFLSSLPGGAVSSFIALYAAAEGIGSGGLYFTFMAIFTGVCRLFSGKTADKNGEGVLVYIGDCSFLLGLVLLIFGHSPLTFYLSACFYGIGYGLTIPALQAMSVRIVPLRRRGSASSTFLCSWDVSFGLGGIIGGALVTWLGYRPMFAILGLSLFAAMAYYRFSAAKSPSAFNAVKQGR